MTDLTKQTHAEVRRALQEQSLRNAAAAQEQESERIRAAGAKREAALQQCEQERQQREADVIAAYKHAQRAAFPGTDAEFASIWPQLLLDLQRQSNNAVDQTQVQLLSSGRYGF